MSQRIEGKKIIVKIEDAELLSMDKICGLNNITRSEYIRRIVSLNKRIYNLYEKRGITDIGEVIFKAEKSIIESLFPPKLF